MRTVVVSVLALASTFAAGACTDLRHDPEGIAFTSSGELVVFLTAQARFFDADAQRETGSMPTGAKSGGWIPYAARYAVSADGRRLAVRAGRIVEVYDAATREPIAHIPVSDNPDEPDPIAGIALSGDGSLVAVSARPIFTDTPARLSVWRVDDQSLVNAIPLAAGRAAWSWSAGLAFSPDGTVLYGVAEGEDDAGTFMANLTAWTIADGAVVWESAVPDPNAPSDVPAGASVDALALSPDGVWLATGGRALNVWRAADGVRQNLAPMEPFPVYLGALHFAPDGQRLVASHYTNALSDPLVFGLDGSIVREFPIETFGCADSVFSPDGTRIAAVCPPSLKVWDAATGARLWQTDVTTPID